MRKSTWKYYCNKCRHYHYSGRGKADDIYIAETRADTSELSRFEHNLVSKLFLSMKYGFAEEGIYPTKIIRISLTPKELFDHFPKIKSQLPTTANRRNLNRFVFLR